MLLLLLLCEMVFWSANRARGQLMKNPVPISLIEGVELRPSQTTGISTVVVSNPQARFDLSWDRFVRLKVAASAAQGCSFANSKILDVGGYDGALALFLPNHHIEVIDPATTGASLASQPVEPLSYDIVTSIDALEHIPPDQREQELSALAAIAKSSVILNYPCRETREAQKLVLASTNNPLIREHVEWDLPDTEWVTSAMQKHGFTTTVKPHANLAVWLGQYMMLNLDVDSSKALNRYLVEHHADEPYSVPLYHLVVCQRR